eukprot:1153229-Pelagomonas_calceolata.AAC.9
MVPVSSAAACSCFYASPYAMQRCQGGYPVAERRKQLSTTYGFTCNCARCKTESAAPENVIEALERMWNRILDENVVQKAQELVSSCMRNCLRAVEVHTEKGRVFYWDVNDRIACHVYKCCREHGLQGFLSSAICWFSWALWWAKKGLSCS